MNAKHRLNFSLIAALRNFILVGIVSLSVDCHSADSDQKAASSGASTYITNAGLSCVIAPAEDYNHLFYREDGWTGGDIAGSLPLRDGRILWLFGDSWIGKIRAGHHTDSALVNNTIALQKGLEPATASLEFFHGNNGGKPAAFIQPAEGGGYFWLSHGGIQTDQALYIFMSRIKKRSGDDSVWNFQSAGMVLARATNPLDVPGKWQIQQTNVPWASYDSAGKERAFGMPLVREGNFIYLYGLEMDNGDRYLLVGRVDAASLEDFSRWEFYAKGSWQPDFRQASRLCNHMGAELSVSYLPKFKRYVLVYTENGLSEKILLRHAATPVGPWSAPVTIYRTPEMGWDKTYFCYAAKAHPELSRQDDELIVTYICNSNDFGKMAGDSRIYFPKFLRIKFSAIP